MQLADLHNFGQSVQRIGRGSESFFQKPRPIFWEWLFFGRNSPLSEFFGHSKLNGFSPRNAIFNLDTDMGPDFSGRSREVVGIAEGTLSETHAYSLGTLLAYCYIFGIRDLHRHNLVKTATHIQVVDAEVVLSKLLLPHETLLLPFKEVGPGECGASVILDVLAGVDVGSIKLLFAGYLDVFNSVMLHRENILGVLQSQGEQSGRIPIRHILRDTFHYRAWPTKTPPIPFFESEIQQLRRGDIPYYFKFLNQSEVFEFTDSAGSFAPVSLPDEFLRGAAREATNPEVLLEDVRLRKSLLPAGLLYLAKTLPERGFVGVVDGRDFQLQILDSEIIVSLPQGKFSAPKS